MAARSFNPAALIGRCNGGVIVHGEAAIAGNAAAIFNVVRFPSSYIGNAAEASLVRAGATIVDANTIRLSNVLVQGVCCNLSLRWNTATQRFALVHHA